MFRHEHPGPKKLVAICYRLWPDPFVCGQTINGVPRDLVVGFLVADYAEDLIGIMNELIARLAELLEADPVKMFRGQLKRFLR